MKRSALKPSAESMKRSRMRASRPKSTPIRKSARGEECTIRLPGICDGGGETTVLCHSNKLVDGKGMGIKASDLRAAYGCASCHAVLDGRAPRPPGLTLEMVDHHFECGIEWTQRLVRLKGLKSSD
jgi:Protein of unknown function (DUF1364)